MNNKIAFILLGIALCVALPAQARDKDHRGHHHHKFHDYAQVIDVEPVFRTVTVPQTEQECWNEDVRRPVRRQVQRDDAGSTLVGGIIGGAIGKHLGHGDPGAMIAGTIMGAAIGHDAASQERSSHEYYLAQEHRCHEYTAYHEERQQDGYNVTYRYHGEVFTTHMDSRPGRRLRVRVIVEPDFR